LLLFGQAEVAQVYRGGEPPITLHLSGVAIVCVGIQLDISLFEDWSSNMSLEELRPGELPQEQVLYTKKDVLSQIMSHLQASEVEPAVSLYRRCHEDVGYELMNLVGSGPLAENLTSLFTGARDDYKAAQVFEKMGALDKAAGSFEKAEAYDLAAELYGRLDNFSKAAEMLERGGSYSRAAPLFAQSERWLDAGRCYEKASQVFEAGEAYVKANDHNKALASLQKVDAGHERYLEAVTLLGPILEELDLPELASRKYREALGESTVGSDNIAIFYSLGKSL
jgi:tetratricopeptide (TPR) repeat protein